MMKFLFLAAGGAAGTLLRYSVSGLTHKIVGGLFPWGTLVVNLAGCFLIGLLWGLFEHENLSPNVRNFLFVGILGGFTTFSTFSLESFHLIRDGQLRMAVTSIMVSNVAGILLVFAGFFLSKTASDIVR